MRFSVIVAIAVFTAHPVFSCDEPVGRAAVALPVAEALQGFSAMDMELFNLARDKAINALPCLSEPLSSREAADYHGLMALNAFLEQDDTQAVNSFRSALQADSSWTLPLDVPDIHPIRTQLKVASKISSNSFLLLPDITPDAIFVDGALSTAIPGDRPVILQRTTTSGKVKETVYLKSGESLPFWAPAPVLTEALPLKQKRPVGLVVGTGASLLASGLCYGLAWNAHDSFVNPDTVSGYPDNPEALRMQANSLTWASMGTAVLAIGLGTVTVVKW